MVQFPTITRSQQLLTKPTKIFLIFISSEYAIVLVKRWNFIKYINFPVNKFKLYSVQPSYMYTSSSSIALRHLLFFDELVQTSSSSITTLYLTSPPHLTIGHSAHFIIAADSEQHWQENWEHQGTVRSPQHCQEEKRQEAGSNPAWAACHLWGWHPSPLRVQVGDFLRSFRDKSCDAFLYGA